MSHIDDVPLKDLDPNPGLKPEQPPAGGGAPAVQLPGKGKVEIVAPTPIAKADPVSGPIVINN